MDMLEAVREKMGEKGRQMKDLAAATGVGYFTVLRIKTGKGDPGYSTVRKLHDYYFPESPKDEVNG